MWGRLSAAGVQRGRPRPVNDMWIAACCLTYDLPLATLNLKDYEDFQAHHGLRSLGTEEAPGSAGPPSALGVAAQSADEGRRAEVHAHGGHSRQPHRSMAVQVVHETHAEERGTGRGPHVVALPPVPPGCFRCGEPAGVGRHGRSEEHTSE